MYVQPSPAPPVHAASVKSGACAAKLAAQSVEPSLALPLQLASFVAAAVCEHAPAAVQVSGSPSSITIEHTRASVATQDSAITGRSDPTEVTRAELIEMLKTGEITDAKTLAAWGLHETIQPMRLFGEADVSS